MHVTDGPVFLIRQAGPEDFEGVFPLARKLDSYNLPADRSYIRHLLKTSEDSFAGRLPRSRAHYLFVLETKTSRGLKIVGCSLIIAKHGIPGHPHLWFLLGSKTMRSRTTGIKRTHRTLQLGYTEDGPTEVGGLIVLPRYRRHPQQCGLQLSYVRFLYMAVHPQRFEKEVLVEYRGAMGRGNRSPFWERIGREFTGFSYAAADRLSVTNKEFIWALLPHEPIYCALLPGYVQKAIGAVHPQARRAAGLLRAIGFKPIPQIEPFDGGPYYTARSSRIRLIRQTKSVRIKQTEGKPAGRYLIGTQKEGRFRAVMAPALLSKGKVAVRAEVLGLLNVVPGERVYVCRV
ncbi:MAG: arginine N-succinyltransferase [Candidatus Omnitrophica bacterium]|nr:arginine N-succinyltransferase [Candidatus Omnitrophota bacterium]